MELKYDGETVTGGEQSRERFYDSRGYGSPHDGRLELAPVEAAHLLFRGDVEAVIDTRGDDASRPNRLDFYDFLASRAVSEVAYFVYADLRSRGFYLSPESNSVGPTDTSRVRDRTFRVFARGTGPWDEEVAFHVRAVSEREVLESDTLLDLTEFTPKEVDGDGTTRDQHTDHPGPTGVLAVVDEESEVTYLSVGEPNLTGTNDLGDWETRGRLLADRVLLPAYPNGLYERAFFGQPLGEGDAGLQVSLVEAAFLASTGILTLEEGDDNRLRERGRAVEGERFDRRLRVYTNLRSAGVVPKTGYKFGADFRTYGDVTDVSNLGHSEHLVRVLPADHEFHPRELALDVRLAHGVRKRMAFALVGEHEIRWLSLERFTP